MSKRPFRTNLQHTYLRPELCFLNLKCSKIVPYVLFFCQTLLLPVALSNNQLSSCLCQRCPTLSLFFIGALIDSSFTATHFHIAECLASAFSSLFDSAAVILISYCAFLECFQLFYDFFSLSKTYISQLTR